MFHIFLEFSDLEPGVKSVEDLNYVLRDADRQSAFVMSHEVAKFVKDAMTFGNPIKTFKNCRFAFNDGAEFVEFDGSGKPKKFADPIPAWFQTPNQFARGQWLINHELHDLITPEFITTFLEMFQDVKKRREHCNLLFDLQLNDPSSREKPAPSTNRSGNKNGITTKPKVADLQSFEIFAQFFNRLKTAVNADQFPTLQVLTNSENVAKVPNALKGSVRTWFKSITGELPPNNKRVEAGNAELFCAPIRQHIHQIESYGLETYYRALSQAIAQAGEQFIADFAFKFPK
ncbi:hypothetical protein SOASR030_07210 [Leminorella grimontii]|uniref:Uncharacterized protein n=2 Tax=Leminorella grimontii TaxID=82981 RepID=A0AAV5MYX0_9GAMM|nr:hypothetical protein [Leminorella grimontii]KFC96202.1 hypothetical protein GLGR_1377 [Leminorella grimontii ATCC 33999 = DSM 5078]GKX54609.1 hypothetical protein SOASR030_07210 [Leminorella grimontii]